MIGWIMEKDATIIAGREGTLQVQLYDRYDGPHIDPVAPSWWAVSPRLGPAAYDEGCMYFRCTETQQSGDVPTTASPAGSSSRQLPSHSHIRTYSGGLHFLRSTIWADSNFEH